jgi:hypothetical protein
MTNAQASFEPFSSPIFYALEAETNIRHDRDVMDQAFQISSLAFTEVAKVDRE